MTHHLIHLTALFLTCLLLGIDYTCASMVPTPQHRMLSGRCSVSARVPKVDDIPRSVFFAKVSMVHLFQSARTFLLYGLGTVEGSAQ